MVLNAEAPDRAEESRLLNSGTDQEPRKRLGTADRVLVDSSSDPEESRLLNGTDQEQRKRLGTADRLAASSSSDPEGRMEYQIPIGSYRDLTEGDFGDVLDRQKDVKKDKPQVPDGGYGWFVVLGCFLSHIIIGSFERNDGVYYLQFKARFGQSAQLTSWPGALVSTLRLFLGPLASAICNLTSVRLTTMVGAAILTLAQILNAYTPNFYFLFFSHAALQGFGRGLMYAPSLIILSSYFDKHLGLAAGLGSSGVGVGTFCLVPLTQHFFETYGFQGTFLIMAGVALNGAVCAMLYRPISMHNRFTRKNKVKDTDKVVVDDDVALVQPPDNADKSNGGSKQLHSQNSPPNKKDEPESLSENVKISPERKIQKDEGCFLSSLKICCPVERQETPGGSKKKLFELGLLKDPSFLMFCISIGLFTSASKAAFTFIPALVKSRNISESDAALVLSISGVFDTFGRIVSGLILDRSALRPFRPLIYNSLIFLIALVSFLLPFLRDFTSMTIMSSLYGTLTGAYISQKSVVLVDILGMENMSNSFGLLICFQAFGTCFGPPLAGALRDAFGGFDEAFYLGGCFMVFAGLLMVASNIFLKIKKRKEDAEEKLRVEEPAL